MSVRDLLSAAGSSSEKLYVDDVFSTYLYSGNGSTQTINNGIDLAGKGGMVWIKQRNSVNTHSLWDSARGLSLPLDTSSTGGQYPFNIGLSFNNNGYSFNTSDARVNLTSSNYTSWTFRKARKFFDVVTYTGDGQFSQEVPHNLGVPPGLIVLKDLAYPGHWECRHISQGIRDKLRLNDSAGKTEFPEDSYRSLKPDQLNFLADGSLGLNGLGQPYIAYLFAHDPSPDGIIQCGSYIGNGSSVGPVVNLGWEPQFLLIKNSTGTGDWRVIDHMRGMPVGSADAVLRLNVANAETAEEHISPTATGFQLTSHGSDVNTTGHTYIYMAIRRPNKPPTSGTQVYNMIARPGTSNATTVTGVEFSPDLLISRNRTANPDGSSAWWSRAVGKTKALFSTYAGGEATVEDGVTGFDMADGVSLGADTISATVNYSSFAQYINHFFRRAPGFFDVVCYTGNGLASQYVSHSLKVKPEIIIAKSRSSGNWLVSWGTTLETSIGLYLNTSSAKLGSSIGIATRFSDENTFYTGTATDSANTLSDRYVAYLFASSPGVSKVGTYTGNGNSQNIACGFTTGARFILIKRVDSTGDWYIWDSERGIVAANDPHLSLNTTAAEVTTDDSVDPDASGFIVNQNTATNINVSNGTYIFLAIS